MHDSPKVSTSLTTVPSTASVQPTEPTRPRHTSTLHGLRAKDTIDGMNDSGPGRYTPLQLAPSSSSVIRNRTISNHEFTAHGIH
nr:hypothetical protein CFP56_48686 [Quercus suber]